MEDLIIPLVFILIGMVVTFFFKILLFKEERYWDLSLLFVLWPVILLSIIIGTPIRLFKKWTK